MQDVLNIINSFQPLIIIGLIVIIILLFILVIAQSKAISRLESKYKKFMRGVDNKNIEELINNYLDRVDRATKETGEMRDLYKMLDSKLQSCIQKVSIMRYRAFEDVGSDLSYSIALLNDKNNGIILTGIYGRNESTTYAKPIDKGISRYDLSDEEKHVLDEAMNKCLE
ncbi:DUF4446 family protein [Clostridium rectalis]|uniref:DUF4446 family protein n=1 Tax=Clostridium rectalis TaxID=2040295 RepID=UPI000F63003F|nr:DUF4446 family protein [Clostridium rectalis]